jgi:glycosyltransferase involved in cell wall biosynthesis
VDYKTLSVLMPVYDEEATIREIIARCLSIELPLAIDLIIVNDGSNDKTAEALADVDSPRVQVLTHSINQGKGAALRTGLAVAKGDLVIIQDADLEYDPNDWSLLLAPLLEGRTKVVYGNRFGGLGKDMSGLHLVGNRLLSLITSLLYGRKINDMETCYKLFDRRVLEPIHIISNRFDFEPEITAKVLRQGYEIFEIPISYAGRQFDEGKKITWRDGFSAVRALVKFRFVKTL